MGRHFECVPLGKELRLSYITFMSVWIKVLEFGTYGKVFSSSLLKGYPTALGRGEYGRKEHRGGCSVNGLD